MAIRIGERRWRQFSLKTMFVVVTLICLGLGYRSYRARAQWLALDALERIPADAR